MFYYCKTTYYLYQFCSLANIQIFFCNFASHLAHITSLLLDEIIHPTKLEFNRMLIAMYLRFYVGFHITVIASTIFQVLHAKQLENKPSTAFSTLMSKRVKWEELVDKK